MRLAADDETKKKQRRRKNQGALSVAKTELLDFIPYIHDPNHDSFHASDIPPKIHNRKLFNSPAFVVVHEFVVE